MIGAIIGAVTSLASSLKSAHDQEKAQKNADKAREQKAVNLENLRNYVMNRDYTQTMEAQAANTQFRETASDMIRQMNGGIGTSGNSDYAKTQMADSINKSAADMATQEAVNGANQKDSFYMNTYYPQKQNLENEEIAAQKEKAAGSSQFGAWADALGTAISGLDKNSTAETGSGIIEGLFNKRGAKYINMNAGDLVNEQQQSQAWRDELAKIYGTK